MTITLSPEIRTRLDAHLDAVENALIQTHCSRERRRGIVDDLEAQILEMLERKNQQPTPSDLEEVLATLDPPAAYSVVADAKQTEPIAGAAGAASVGTPVDSSNTSGGGTGGRGAQTPLRARLSRMAIAGCMCILTSMFFSGLSLLLLVMGVFPAARYDMSRQSGQAITNRLVAMPAPEVEMSGNRVIVPANGLAITQMRFTQPRAAWSALTMAIGFVALPMPLGLLGTLLGWLAFSRIRASNGTLYGRGLALFDGLFYPIICGLFLFLILPIPVILLTLVAGAIVVVVLLLRFIPTR